MNSWLILLAGSAALVLYAYALYPLLLLVARMLRRAPAVATAPLDPWPDISITLPAYNAESTLKPVLEALVHADYPASRRQILVVSDGSTDGTDALVRRYASHGVELLRIEGRLGKTEVENQAMASLRGEIVVNTDSSVTVRPDAIKRLVAAFADKTVGVASARDVSVESVGAVGNASEAAYVGYEMWIRDLETAVDGIIGSSGCLYAIRAGLHRRTLPGPLSRDFSSALWARLNGFRAVSVRDAICFVPRAANVRVEYSRKIRTMSRGIQTLFYHAALLNPFRYGWFAWFLWSHKLLRWLVPWALLACATSVAALASSTWWAAVATAGFLTGLLLGALGWVWPQGDTPPRLVAMATYFISGSAAALVAWKRALAGDAAPVWEPTPRALGSSSDDRP